MANNVEKLLTDKLTPIIADLGYELVDVEMRKINDTKNITVFIYNEDGISLDDCEKVHGAIDEPLDEINPTNDEPYILNVSSPGLDRPLVKPRDFERNIGLEVELKFYKAINGVKEVVGILCNFDDELIELEIDEVVKKFNKNSIAVVRPYVRF